MDQTPKGVVMGSKIPKPSAHVVETRPAAVSGTAAKHPVSKALRALVPYSGMRGFGFGQRNPLNQPLRWEHRVYSLAIICARRRRGNVTQPKSPSVSEAVAAVRV